MDPSFRAPADVLLTYYDLRWRGPLPDAEIDLTLEPRYLSHRDRSVEIGLLMKADVDGQTVASALTVLRFAGTATSWGQRSVPPVPTVEGELDDRTIVISEREVVDFSACVGEPRDAPFGSGGLPPRLPQHAGPGQRHADGAPGGGGDRGDGVCGHVDRAPLPAGASCHLGYRSSSPAVSEIRLMNGSVASVATSTIGMP